MNEADHKAFEEWWTGVPKINFAGTESQKNAAEAAWIARAAHSDTTTAAVQNIIADEYLANVTELVHAVEQIRDRHLIPLANEEGQSTLRMDLNDLDDALEQLKEQHDETK